MATAMAITPVAFRVTTASDLEVAFDAALAPLLNAVISGVEIDQVRPGPYADRNLYGVFSYTAPGSVILATPFRMRAFSHSDEAQVLILINQFIAANPGYFFSDSYFTYRSQTPNPDDGVIGCIFYNADGAVAAQNWGGSGAVVGAAGGDLGGVYPNPSVVGIQGVPVSAAAPVSGATLIFNATSGQWESSHPILYFADSAAAVAAAPFIDGTFVVLYPGTPIAEAGTYQVIANGGVAFPGDYTKINDNTDTAAEVNIVDVGNFFTSTEVEGALQELGPLLAASAELSGALPDAATTAMDSVPVATYGAAHWEIELVNGTSRYKSTVNAATDGATANGIESDIALGPGLLITPFIIDVDVVAGNMRLTAALTAPGWSFRVRRLLLTA